MRRAPRLAGRTIAAACLGVPLVSPKVCDATVQNSTFVEGHVFAPLRVVQYNVRRFTNDSQESTVATIGQSIQGISPAIVSLNEVDLKKCPECVLELGKSLGLPYSHFFGHVRGTYGNALLSRFPISAVRDVHLEGGSVLEWPHGSGNQYTIRRGMLMATVEMPCQWSQEDGCAQACHKTVPITVLVTHLDHMDETQRLVQMRHVLAEMQGLADEPHLLLGDLNALCTDDYDAEEWAEILAMAHGNGWRAPRDADSVRLLHAHGYTDAFRAASNGISAAGNGCLPSGPWKFTAHVDRPMYRIDYAFLSPRFEEALQIRLTRAYVDPGARGSDHLPLVIEFEPRTGAKL